MKVYGDLLSKGLYPLASGQTSDEITKVARNKYIYRTNTSDLGSRQFEMLVPSGSILPGSIKRFGLYNVCGRLFFASSTPNKLCEYNVETNTISDVLETFNPSHWFFTSWQNMIIGPDQTYDVLTGSSYSHTSGPDRYCRPFEYNGKLYTFAAYAGYKYNASGHKWDAVNFTDFKNFDFYSYKDETGVSSRSVNIVQGATHNGKLYMAGQAVISEGRNHNTVFTWDGQKIKSIATAKFTQESDTDGPHSLFRAGGKLWVVDRTSNVYEINHQDVLTKSFVVPEDGLFGYYPIVYFGDEVISICVNDYCAYAVYAFNGSRFAEIGDWDSQFPGCGIEGMSLVNGYLYILGGVHLVQGTAFMTRIYIGDLSNYNEQHNRMMFEVDRNIGSHLRGLSERTMASGAIIDQRFKLDRSFRLAASGDFYGDTARSWELIAKAWDASERRCYDMVSWHGNLYIEGTDTDSIYRINTAEKTVTDVATMNTTFGDFGRHNHEPIQSYLFGDADAWDGTTRYDIAVNATNYRVRQYKNRIYFFDNDSPYRILGWNAIGKGWWDWSSWTAWNNIKATGVYNMVEAGGHAFLHYGTNPQTVLKWNGNPDTAATVIYTCQASEAPRLFVLNNDLYLWADGGTNDGKIYKFNWVTDQFVLYLNSAYSCAGGAELSFAEKDCCMYMSAVKISDSSRKLIRFNGSNVQEITSMPNPEPNGDYLCFHNGALYLLIFDVSGLNQMYLYRYNKSLLGEEGSLRKDMSEIKLSDSLQHSPPSGVLLPVPANYNYGDWYYLNASGNAFYRKGINNWHLVG